MVAARLVLLVACVVSSLAQDEVVRLEALPTGASKLIGYYAPQRLELSATQPASLKKPPPDLTAPLFGVIAIAGGEGLTYHVIVEEPEGKPFRLFVDANGNGDLTDDAGAEWTAGKPTPADDGKMLVTCNGGATLNLGAGAQPFLVHLAMYRFDKNDAKRPQLKNMLLYYRDYGREGQVNLGGKSFHALLNDEFASGDFRGKAVDGDEEGSGVNLLVDVNGNGRFDRRGEAFDVRKPFNIGGVTYEIAELTRDGASFRIVRSTQSVAEIPTPPDLSVGKQVPAFDAVTMGGNPVHFPGDYRGKVVMLDFWATWCGPCMAEVPNVVAAHRKLHARGFEILGVTLDNKEQEAKIKNVMDQKGMTWPQVYDGGGWKAKIAVAYGIDSIPATLLVDGDTGAILAVGARGDQLEPAIVKALEAKAR